MAGKNPFQTKKEEDETTKDEAGEKASAKPSVYHILQKRAVEVDTDLTEVHWIEIGTGSGKTKKAAVLALLNQLRNDPAADDIDVSVTEGEFKAVPASSWDETIGPVNWEMRAVID